MKKQTSKHKNEPIDVSKLTTLKDLIFAAMGPPDKNIVNFKMVQAILMILAQQLRMLERPVDYRSLEEVKTAQSERESAERESEKTERDGGEGENAERESEKTERDRGKREKLKKTEKDGGKGEKAEEKSVKSERDGAKREKTEKETEKTEKDGGKGEKAEKKGKKSEKDKGKREKAEKASKTSEKDGGEGEKSEKEGEKSESNGGGEKTETESKKSEQDRGKGKNAERASKKSQREREKGKKGAKESEKSETDGGEGEKTERECDKTEKNESEEKKAERESDKIEIGEEESTERESDKTQKDDGEEKNTERESEKTERDGREEEKAETDSYKTERDEREKEKTETESEKSEREIEKSERASDRSERASDRSERASEISERASDISEKESEKSEKESEIPQRYSKKSEKKSEEAEIEKAGQKKEKTGRLKEKSGREKEKTKPEREKTEPEREMTEPKREKTETEREKTEREREKPGRERENTGREKGEKEKNIPLMEKAAREKKGKDKPLIEESYISITDKDKVLVVEKLPTSRRGTLPPRASSIPVVTVSQFKLLEAAVKALEEKASPIPLPSMPDNQTLRDDIAKGNATLTDTMQAMQVSARVQAAEEAINRMAVLLTDMAAKGAVPKDLAGQMESFAADAKAAGSRKHDPSTTAKGAVRASKSSVFGAKALSKGVIRAAKQAFASIEYGSLRDPNAPLAREAPQARKAPQATPLNFVTHPQLTEALSVLRNNLTKSSCAMTANVQKIAEQSRDTVSNALEKAAIVSGMDARIETLNKKLDEHSEQLAIADAGVTSQLDSFNSQLGLVRSDLEDGIIQFDSVNTDAETQALAELNEKYDKLVEMLDITMDSHKDLAAGQNDLNVDMQSILTCVEMLQEEKSDRDEMMDRLRDKADISALDNLLPAKKFDVHIEILDEKLGRCHGKFDRQDSVWQNALEDLSAITYEKSDLLQLLKLKEDTEKQLKEINKKLRCLAYALGEPKAALLARQLSLGARCGSCNKPAIQETMDKSYIKDSKDKPFAKPRRLPAAYFSYMGAGDPCEVETNAPTMEEAQQHVCQRWVGGSHTLINTSVKRAQAEPTQEFEPTKKYTGYGDDGRLYNMEESLDPCQHCSPKENEEVQVDGAGDTDHMVHVHIIGEPQTADE